MPIAIAPSILAADFSRLGEQAARMEQAGADRLHLDCMDGHFVPNISFGPPVIASLRPVCGLAFDAHLMLTHPLRYVEAFAAAGCDIVTFHVESESDVAQSIAAIRQNGMEAGLSVRPGTPVERVYPYLDQLAQVLIMTVEPGFGGQAFLSETRAKIAALRRETARRGLSLGIEVDGGIDETTAPLVARDGADILVAGSSLFRAADYAAAILALRRAAERAIAPDPR